MALPDERSALFALHGINHFYGPVHAVKDLELTVKRGSIGLLGPNGAGKSTLLKLLLGLLRPAAGSLQVLGYDPLVEPLPLREKVGYMPENDCYVASMDAVELCTLAAELSGLPRREARERANTVLSFVGLEDKRYMKVQTYSTGQKQRVKLAQAVVHDPALLLLDEPTNGLDPKGRDEMLELIAELPARAGCSVVLSSHLLPDVEAVCKHAVLLADGQVRYNGPIAAMRESSRLTYEVKVKTGSDTLARALEQAGCLVSGKGDALEVGLPDGATPDLVFERALAEELQVRHLAPLQQSLESAFVRLVGAGGQ